MPVNRQTHHLCHIYIYNYKNSCPSTPLLLLGIGMLFLKELGKTLQLSPLQGRCSLSLAWLRNLPQGGLGAIVEEPEVPLVATADYMDFAKTLNLCGF